MQFSFLSHLLITLEGVLNFDKFNNYAEIKQGCLIKDIHRHGI